MRVWLSQDAPIESPEYSTPVKFVYSAYILSLRSVLIPLYVAVVCERQIHPLSVSIYFTQIHVLDSF